MSSDRSDAQELGGVQNLGRGGLIPTLGHPQLGEDAGDVVVLQRGIERREIVELDDAGVSAGFTGGPMFPRRGPTVPSPCNVAGSFRHRAGCNTGTRGFYCACVIFARNADGKTVGVLAVSVNCQSVMPKRRLSSPRPTPNFREKHQRDALAGLRATLGDDIGRVPVIAPVSRDKDQRSRRSSTSVKCAPLADFTKMERALPIFFIQLMGTPPRSGLVPREEGRRTEDGEA